MHLIRVTLLLTFGIWGALTDPISSNCGIIDGNESDLRTKVPWTAAVFMRSNENSAYKFLVNGVVLGPTTILTVLGGAFGDPLPNGGNYRIPSPTNNVVITGLISDRFEDWDDKTQLSQISYISPYRLHHEENKHFHLALIHLRSPLNLETPYVRAICLNNHIPISLSKPLSLSGLGKPSSVQRDLQVTGIQLGGQKECEAKFSNIYNRDSKEVFCGWPAVPCTESKCTSSHGSVVVLEDKRIWYLKGITALIHRSKDTNSTTYFFADFTKTTSWIEKSKLCGPTNFYCKSAGCIPLGKVCNIDEDCENGEDENRIFCKASSRCPQGTFQCGLHGICLKNDKLCNGAHDCIDGSDELFNVCVAHKNKMEDNTTQIVLPFRHGSDSSNLKSCRRLQLSEGVVAKCVEVYETEHPINCSLAKTGAIVTLSCANHYHSTYRLPTIKMNCKDDGSWSPSRQFACAPNCGRLGRGFKLNIANGVKTSTEVAFPWYAAIFLWNGTDYNFICGSSLAERSVLFTAAHCLVNISEELVNVKLLRVVLSPISNEFKKNSEDRFTQILEVKETFVPNTYNSKTLQSDIGIIILKTPVEFGDFVSPVCYLVPFNTDMPKPGSFGKIAGLGVDENLKISQVLKYATFPVVSNAECHSALDSVIPLNTFCAGHKNGTSVCKGDSGGGLVFQEPNTKVERYVLKGIVSHSELGNRVCDLENFAVFTHVDAFSTWILDILSKFQ